MTEQQRQPVHWDGLRPSAGGPRHYAGPEANQRVVWRCARCGNENTGEPGAGCSSCGGGGGAKHVGVDPIVLKGKAEPDLWQAQNVRPRARFRTVAHDDDDLDQSFSLWALEQQLTPADIGRFYPAFKAGWDLRGPQGATMTTIADATDGVPSVGPVIEEEGDEAVAPTDPLLGSIEDRTIVAALEYFRDQILSQQPEEIETGEWLAGPELAALIQQYKEKLV